MLKKVLKAAAKLEARAKKSDRAQLADGTPMLKKLRRAVVDLDERSKQHDTAAALARRAAQRLSELFKTDARDAKEDNAAPLPAAKKPAVKTKPTAKKIAAAKSVAPSKGKPTLAAAIQHVLETRRTGNAGGVKARQLYAEVQQAGYKFGGNNIENRMSYLHKTLRQNSTRFKRAADGTIALA